ncbi:MAG: RND family transporter [Deltaproteobacteria bacterium]|uniref:RND family transporter n=1 Tax=Candidatus Zymogenus saltonus TaxID=2844893 RepID=A0A9D8KDQ7_9DELT|nr:RND family transporter [Candidatus Zymogenus saltonus]
MEKGQLIKKRHALYRRLAVLVTDHPMIVIGLVSLITVFFAINIFRLKIDPDPWKMLPQDDPAVIYWEEVEELFGRSDAAIVAVVSPGTIYNETSLGKIEALTEMMEKLIVVDEKDLETIEELIEETDGEVKELLSKVPEGGLTKSDIGPVKNALRILRAEDDPDEGLIEELEGIRIGLEPFKEVMSLSTVENIESIGGVLDTGPIMEDVPETFNDIKLLRDKILGNDMLAKKIVSEDETATIIFTNLTFTSHEERTIAIYKALKDMAVKLGGPEEYYVSGTPMILGREASYMKDDMSLLIPAVILLIMVILFVVFRNLRGMVTPLLVVLISTIWTMGLMAILGYSISIISTTLPVILVAIGCADGIHIITEFYGRLSGGGKKRDAMVDTMEEISSPVIMTSLTSMAGFGSLVTSSLSPIREFGAFTAFGILAAMIFSLIFIPAMMMILKTPPKLGMAVDRNHSTTPLTSFLDTLGRVSINRRRLIFALMIPAFIAVIFVATRVEVGYGFMNDFKKRSEIVIADELINEKFPGSTSLNIIIDSGAPDGIKDPDFLMRVERLQDYLASDELVGSTSSITDFLRRMNYVMNDNDPKMNRLPNPTEEITVEGEDGKTVKEVISGRDMNAQYLLLYENSGGEDMEKVVDFEYRKVNLVMQLKSSYSRDIMHLQKMAGEFIDENFGDGEEVHLTGTGHMVVVISHYIIKSQIISLATSLIVVFLMLVLVFRSIKAASFSMLPLIFTIFSNFTLMRIFDVNLDVATAMIASMGLGIGIDYSIHFVSRYRIETAKGLDVNDALFETIHNTGRALVFNAVAVAAGFIILVLSNFKPIMNVGWLVSATMIISASATLIIIPALVSIFKLDAGR